MIDMDELYEYENQPCTDMADELEMLEITHEIMAKEKEKTERERKQHLSEGNDTDVYATQDAPAEQKQDNTVTSTEAPEKPENKNEKNAEEKTDEKHEQHKNKTGGGSSSAESNATVAPGVLTGENANRETTCKIGRNTISSDQLMKHVMGRIWYASITDSDKNTFKRVRQIKKALSVFKSEKDLLMHINDYIDDGKTMNEETFFCLTAIYKYDARYFRNYKAYSIDRNSRHGKALDDFIKSIPMPIPIEPDSKNHS